MILLTALLAGFVFGLGLIVSGMANPAKVLGFLDVSGAWDPSLLLVMAGAIGVAALAFRLARGRRHSLIGLPMHLPAVDKIDRRLAAGAIVFGIGWGIAGFCPGPALVGLGMGVGKAMLFVAAMVCGMLLFELIDKMRKASSS
jgi:uncharacterized membrane protein YedE/YeeE